MIFLVSLLQREREIQWIGCGMASDVDPAAVEKKRFWKRILLLSIVLIIAPP